ncbi:MAG: alpha/beta fold hydrolase [Nevskiales bacterium]
MTNSVTCRIALPDGTELSCRIQGSGALPIVFVHGYAMSLECWERVLERLPADWTGYAYDLRGFGASGKAGPHSFARYEADLLVLLDAFGLDRPVLAGHSLGANLLQEFAVTHPARFRALVLSDAAARNLPPPDAVAARVQQRIAAYGSAEVNRAILRRRMADYFDAGNVTDADLDRFSELGARADTAALREMLLASYCHVPIPDAQLRRIHAPVLLIYGANDRVTPPTQAGALLRALPQTEMSIIPHCGHTPMWENPDAWVGRVRHFLSQH